MHSRVSAKQDDRAAAVASDAKKRDALLLNAFQILRRRPRSARMMKTGRTTHGRTGAIAAQTLAPIACPRGYDAPSGGMRYAGIRDKWRPHSSTFAAENQRLVALVGNQANTK